MIMMMLKIVKQLKEELKKLEKYKKIDLKILI
jgi:hypothetical protein